MRSARYRLEGFAGENLLDVEARYELRQADYTDDTARAFYKLELLLNDDAPIEEVRRAFAELETLMASSEADSTEQGEHHATWVAGLQYIEGEDLFVAKSAKYGNVFQARLAE